MLLADAGLGPRDRDHLADDRVGRLPGAAHRGLALIEPAGSQSSAPPRRREPGHGARHITTARARSPGPALARPMGPTLDPRDTDEEQAQAIAAAMAIPYFRLLARAVRILRDASATIAPSSIHVAASRTGTRAVGTVASKVNGCVSSARPSTVDLAAALSKRLTTSSGVLDEGANADLDPRWRAIVGSARRSRRLLGRHGGGRRVWLPPRPSATWSPRRRPSRPPSCLGRIDDVDAGRAHDERARLGRRLVAASVRSTPDSHTRKAL